MFLDYRVIQRNCYLYHNPGVGSPRLCPANALTEQLSLPPITPILLSPFESPDYNILRLKGHSQICRLFRDVVVVRSEEVACTLSVHSSPDLPFGKLNCNIPGLWGHFQDPLTLSCDTVVDPPP